MAQSASHNVLITGGGAPGAPGVLRCLRADPTLRIIVADARPDAVGRFLHPDLFITIPPAQHPEFTPTVLHLCAQHQVQVVLPLVTRELPLWAAQQQHLLSQGTHVVVSEPTTLHIANNKHLLLQHLQQHGVPTPRFKLAAQPHWPALLEAIYELGYPQQPVCIKPTLSNGSRGVRILDPNADRYRLFMEQKPGHLYTTLSELQDTLQHHTLPPMLVMEHLPGPEWTVDTLTAPQCTPLLVLPRKRTHIREGISVAGVFESPTELIAHCQQILHTLPGLSGPIGLQFKQSATSDYRLLEINPRIQGTSVAALGAGINIPLLAVHQALGKSIIVPAPRWGTHFIRYYQEVFW